MTERTAAPRFEHIDALRAIAALLVVWTHTSEGFTYVTTSAAWVHDISAQLDFGRIGVVVFFMVSGFVIPSSLDREGPKLALAREFVIKRFFRLYPIFWLSIPLGILTFYAIWNKPFDWLMVAANFTMIQEFLGFQSAQGLYWTLQTELVFYLVCILLFLTVGIRSTRVVAITALVILAIFLVGDLRLTRHGLLGDGVFHWVAGHLSIMFMGTLLRRWHDRRLTGWDSRAITIFLVLFWAAVPLGAVRLLPFTWAQQMPPIPLSYVIGLGIFLLGAFVVRIRQPGIVAVGRASYSLYLFHPIVFWPIVRVAEMKGFEWMTGYPLYIYVAVAGGLAIVVALFLYRTVELPMIAMGSRLSKRRLPQPVVEAI